MQRQTHDAGRSLAMSAAAAAERDPTSGMRRLPGGSFTMGSENFYPQERPRCLSATIESD